MFLHLSVCTGGGKGVYLQGVEVCLQGVGICIKVGKGSAPGGGWATPPPRN